MRRLVLGLSFLLLSFAAAAADDGELARLHGTLSALSQEQQAVYQQFQMVQELRRANAQAIYAGQLGFTPYLAGTPNYDEVVAAQNNAMRRDKELAAQAEQLYARYTEFDARKKPILQRIYELTLTR